jgi:exonuclease SbcD
MRVAAFGDAHLGRSYLPYTAHGVNVREQDFERSFESAVDLALAQQPELVIWLGDIFDHPRPSYRSFRLAQRALRAIRDHGVEVVVITGNHDTPRLPGQGSPYSALADTFGGDRGGVHFAHRLQYERFEFGGPGGLVVHAVPQMLTVDATLDALDQADKQRDLDRTNLLLAHPLVPSVERRYADINEIEVDTGRLRSDLVLLGHYHFHVKVGDGIWYAGSTDTFTFADDPDKAKGVVVLDTDSGACTHVPLPGQRPLVTLETVDAIGLSPAEVQQRVLERASTVPDGAVARLFVDNVDPEAYRLLDLDAVRDAAANALHLKLEPTFTGAAYRWEPTGLDTMPARWAGYVEHQDLTGFDRERIKTLGDDYLLTAVEEAVE